MIEYVLIGGVNDMPEVAHELGALMQRRSVKLNFIPYNPSDVPDAYLPPSEAAVLEFVSICKSYGLFSTVGAWRVCAWAGLSLFSRCRTLSYTTDAVANLLHACCICCVFLWT